MQPKKAQPEKAEVYILSVDQVTFFGAPYLALSVGAVTARVIARVIAPLTVTVGDV